MAGNLMRGQFITGCIDGLRFPKALITLLQYSKVRTISSLVFFLNGVLYLGVELFYQFFTGYVFPHDHPVATSGLLSLKTILVLGASWGCSIAHFFWTLSIYLVSLVLSLIWVQ
jgi:hypothetical protein